MATNIDLDGKLLITGHTGFKGTWLTLLAQSLGLEVVGISRPPDKDSLYSRLNRTSAIEEYFLDINNLDATSDCIKRIKPNFVLHLAAQALVEESYLNPIQTFQTNVMGTAHVLSVSLETGSVQAIGIATTDKVYRNNNARIPFVEDDPLGGKDPYSASKVGTESVVNAWRQLTELRQGPPVISLRAGNVIGGGDMAKNRIIPDLIRSKIDLTPAVIRNSKSTRPWQHVLDPLTGYLKSMQKVSAGELDAASLNFGPTGDSLSVAQLVTIALSIDQSIPTPIFQSEENSTKESIHLSLDSSLASSVLPWSNHWSQQEAIEGSIEWWKSVIEGSISPIDACEKDIQRVLN